MAGGMLSRSVWSWGAGAKFKEAAVGMERGPAQRGFVALALLVPAIIIFLVSLTVSPEWSLGFRLTAIALALAASFLLGFGPKNQ
jgi:hypothetical protein